MENEDGTIPPTAAGGPYARYQIVGATTTTKYAFIDQDSAEILELAQGQPTGNAYVQPTPNTTVNFGYGTGGTYVDYLTVTSPPSGVVMSVSVEIPNP